MSDSILIRLGNGDQAAVDECLARYGGLVWSLARRLSPTPADAEDAAQEIFVEIWQKADRYDPAVAAESTFITMIARRRLIDRHRRRSRVPDTVSMGDESRTIPDPDNRNRMELQDEAAKAAECLDHLNLTQRRAVELSVYGGISHTRISESLGVPLGTVKTNVRRGLIQLRECMQRTLKSVAKGGVS